MSPASAEARERRGLLRHVLVPVVLLLLLVAAFNGLLIDRVAITLDQKAQAAQTQSVASVMKRFRLKLEATTSDYTWWDDFYLAIDSPGFNAWTKINLSGTLSSSFEATEAWIVAPDGRIVYGWSAAGADPAIRFAGEPELEALRRKALARKDVNGPHAVSAFALIDGRLHIVSAGVIAPTDARLHAAPDRSYDVFIVASDAAAFAYPRLAEDFSLTGLTFSTVRPESGAPAIPLADAAGLTIGYLTWTVDDQIGAFWSGYWTWGFVLLLGVTAALVLLARRWNALIGHFVSVSLTVKAAEEASAAKSAFIANMSHELRTPLNAIIGFSEILTMEVFGPHGVPKYLEYAHDIQSSGQHLLTLINDILSIAKIEAGQHRIALEPCALDDAADTAVRMVASLAADANVGLVIAQGRPPLSALADPKALRQILVNLLSNAVKFTEPGGKVTLSWSERRLDRAVEITVSDTGIGIAKDKLPMLGTPFFQVADVHARNTGGAGLGLSIVNGLVLAMSGTVTIDSELGRGTTVTVRLPLAKRSRAALEAA